MTYQQGRHRQHSHGQNRPNVWPNLSDAEVIARVLKGENPDVTHAHARFHHAIECCWHDDPAARYALRAVQFHPNRGQFDFARSPARTPHVGAYV